MLKDHALNLQDKGRWSWLEWTLATIAGYTLGMLALLPWVVGQAYAPQPALWMGGVAGAVLGGALGLAQWLVLRRHGQEVDARWLLASVIGGALGLAFGLAVGNAVSLAPPIDQVRGVPAPVLPLGVALQTAVTGALVGLGLGGAQWLALRRSLQLGPWWVLANGLGWMMGLGLGAMLAPLVGVIGALLIAGISGGVLSGIGLQRWLR
jgi:hypothetical protein